MSVSLVEQDKITRKLLWAVQDQVANEVFTHNGFQPLKKPSSSDSTAALHTALVKKKPSDENLAQEYKEARKNYIQKLFLTFRPIFSAFKKRNQGSIKFFIGQLDKAIEALNFLCLGIKDPETISEHQQSIKASAEELDHDLNYEAMNNRDSATKNRQYPDQVYHKAKELSKQHGLYSSMHCSQRGKTPASLCNIVYTNKAIHGNKHIGRHSKKPILAFMDQLSRVQNEHDAQRRLGDQVIATLAS